MSIHFRLSVRNKTNSVHTHAFSPVWNITGVCPCSSFDVYSFGNTNSGLPSEIIGTYQEDSFSLLPRKRYQKDGSINVKIEYDNDRWKIFDHTPNPKKLLALQKTPIELDVCLSDTMHIEWGSEDPSNPSNVLPFTAVKHRCKGKQPQMKS